LIFCTILDVPWAQPPTLQFVAARLSFERAQALAAQKCSDPLTRLVAIQQQFMKIRSVSISSLNELPKRQHHALHYACQPSYR